MRAVPAQAVPAGRTRVAAPRPCPLVHPGRPTCLRMVNSGSRGSCTPGILQLEVRPVALMSSSAWAGGGGAGQLGAQALSSCRRRCCS